MISYPPPISFRPGRRRKKQATVVSPPPPPPPPPPPVGLTLVQVAYSAGMYAELTFDRAIDIGGFNPMSVGVSDPSTTNAYQGNGAFLANDQTVHVDLQITGPSSSESVVMSVAGGNGIVAVDDGGTYGGVSDQVIPFP
jgi:hypothetical protein